MIVSCPCPVDHQYGSFHALALWTPNMDRFMSLLRGPPIMDRFMSLPRGPPTWIVSCPCSGDHLCQFALKYGIHINYRYTNNLFTAQRLHLHQLKSLTIFLSCTCDDKGLTEDSGPIPKKVWHGLIWNDAQESEVVDIQWTHNTNGSILLRSRKPFQSCFRMGPVH